MKKKKEFEFIFEYSLSKDNITMDEIESNAKRILDHKVLTYNSKNYPVKGYWIKLEYDLDTVKVIFEVDDSI
ncbi:MAG: hypothetical protein ACRC92_20155 [Peptostreptococcaceae bacterium]